MYNNQFGMSNKQSGGCGLCKFAGTGTKGSDIMPALSPQEDEEFRKARFQWGADYFCVVFGKPVRNEQGVVCPQWKDDRS